jgi:PAS domain S-box-containing protein
MSRSHVALRTALVFFAFGALWVILSDVTLAAFVGGDAEAVTRLQTVKGWFFIAAASVLVYLLAARVAAAEQRERDLLRSRSAELIEAQQVARVGHWVLDPGEGGFRCSEELYRILGLDTSSKLTYQGFLDAAEPDHSERLANARHRLRSGGESLNTVYPIRHPSGDVRWVQEKVTRHPDRAGVASRLTGSVADVTELVEGARELQGRVTLLERALSSVDDGVLVRRDGEILDCNAAACRILGYERSELLGKDPDRLSLVDERRNPRRPPPAGDSAPAAKRVWGRRKSGEAFACELTVLPLPEDQGIEGGQIVVIREVGDERDEREPRDSYYRSRHSALEEERRRLATDLHDGVGQVLSRVRAQLEGVLAALPGGQAPRSKVQEAAAVVDDAAGDVRHIANQLRPDALDKQGLGPALAWLCGEFDRRHGIDCTFAGDGGEIPLSPERAVLAYRVVEEALANVSRHAPGASATVTASRRGDQLHFRVDDDGPGFDPETDGHGGGLGLAGMHERAALLGGRLGIGRREGGGTSVQLDVSVG